MARALPARAECRVPSLHRPGCRGSRNGKAEPQKTRPTFLFFCLAGGHRQARCDPPRGFPTDGRPINLRESSVIVPRAAHERVIIIIIIIIGQSLHSIKLDSRFDSAAVDMMR
ncbi:hypothetical protein SUGI_0450230 [Cryptomeria japonica]|nr:hypothetical protein SUGI_0450230 [Cryptomeria japonica]